MPESHDQAYHDENIQRKAKDKNRYLLHIGLFIITFITTTLAGAQWISAVPGPYEISYLLKGLPYSISILFVISCHEFGHYFAAKFHKVKATLPYYIPFPPAPYFLNFGTMGAVIRTKSPIHTKKVMFDIGVAGPLAGFAASLIVLIYGFINLPAESYILSIHPNFFLPSFGKGEYELIFGNTILFSFFKMIFADPNNFFPPMSEIYHYPYLCVGWFGLFITAMNMIPIGQLDGGHIGYTLFGEKKHYTIAVVSFILLFASGVVGIAGEILEWNTNIGWSGWLFWALILYFIIKLKHPPIHDTSELDPARKFLGYLSFVIFGVCFSPVPFILTIPQ